MRWILLYDVAPELVPWMIGGQVVSLFVAAAWLHWGRR